MTYINGKNWDIWFPFSLSLFSTSRIIIKKLFCCPLFFSTYFILYPFFSSHYCLPIHFSYHLLSACRHSVFSIPLRPPKPRQSDPCIRSVHCRTLPTVPLCPPLMLSPARCTVKCIERRNPFHCSLIPSSLPSSIFHLYSASPILYAIPPSLPSSTTQTPLISFPSISVCVLFLYLLFSTPHIASHFLSPFSSSISPLHIYFLFPFFSIPILYFYYLEYVLAVAIHLFHPYISLLLSSVPFSSFSGLLPFIFPLLLFLSLAHSPPLHLRLFPSALLLPGRRHIAHFRNCSSRVAMKPRLKSETCGCEPLVLRGNTRERLCVAIHEGNPT